jgi:hypothetical protein
MVDCDRQYTFNNIVDTKQRVMGLVLDGVTEEKAKFLLVTKAQRPSSRRALGVSLTASMTSKRE